MWLFPNIATLFTLVLTNIQYVGLLSNIDLRWPDEWSNYFQYFNVVNLNIRDIFGESEVMVIDYRTWFMFVAIGIPLFLNICILLLYQDFKRIFWYIAVVFGTIIFIAGALSKVLPSAGLDSSDSGANLYMIIGGSLVFVALCAALINYIYHRQVGQESVEEKLDKVHEENEKFHRRRTFIQFSISMILLMIGVLLAGIVNLHIAAINDTTSSLGGFVSIMGYACLGFGAWMFFMFLINLCAIGRKIVDRVSSFLKANLLMLLLIGVNSSFIPTLQFSMNMFMCASYECPAGTVFNPYASRPTTSYDISSSRFCDNCTFLNSGCAGSDDLVTELCPAWTGYRNWQNPEVPCDDESIIYFYFSAGICLVAYSLAIPILYKKIIDKLVPNLQSKIKVDPSMPEREQWEHQTLLCRPAAASLYEPFFLDRKYYNVLLLIQRLFIVTTVVIIAPFNDLAAAVVFGIHLIVAILGLAQLPFMNHWEMGFYEALAISNMTNGAYTLWVWVASGDIPAGATIVFVFINFALPVLVILVMLAIYCTKSSQWEAEDKERTKHRRAEYKEKKAKEDAERAEIDEDAAFEEEDDADWDGWSDGSWADGFSSGGSTPRSGASSVTGTPRSNASTPRSNSPTSTRTKKNKRASRYEVNVGVDDEDENEPTYVPKTGNAAVDEKAAKQAKKDAKKRKKKKERKIAKAVAAVKEVMNENTGAMLSRFFMIIGLFFFVALGAAVLGTLRQAPSKYIIGHSSIPTQRGNRETLADYPAWANFSSECCCLKSNNPSVNFNTTERWVCKNGNILDKGRISKALEHNATVFRDICSEVVPTGCEIRVVDGAARLSCSDVIRYDTEPYKSEGVSDIAYTYYW